MYVCMYIINYTLRSTAGALLEDHREVGLSGVAVGAIHHNEWTLPIAHELKRQKNCLSRRRRRNSKSNYNPEQRPTMMWTASNDKNIMYIHISKK